MSIKFDSLWIENIQDFQQHLVQMKNSRNIYNIVFWSRYPFYQLTFVHVRDIVCWILYRWLNVSMRIYFASFDRNNDLLAKTIKRIGLRRWHGPVLTTHNSMYLFSFYVLASLIRYHTCNCGYACMKSVILNQVWEILWGSLMILQFLFFSFYLGQRFHVFYSETRLSLEKTS